MGSEEGCPGNHEATVAGGGRRGWAGGRGVLKNAKTNADKEKARKQMLTVLEAATALTEAPSSVKSIGL